jgi:hypothetical protein
MDQSFLRGIQLIKKFPIFYGNKRIIDVFRKSTPWILPESVQLGPHLTLFLSSILTFFFLLCLGLQSEHNLYYCGCSCTIQAANSSLRKYGSSKTIWIIRSSIPEHFFICMVIIVQTVILVSFFGEEKVNIFCHQQLIQYTESVSQENEV